MRRGGVRSGVFQARVKRSGHPHQVDHGVDEIAERLDSAWSATMFAALIDERYAAMRRTILAGNVAPGDFAAVVGESVASRCNEGGGLVVCDWASYRGDSP